MNMIAESQRSVMHEMENKDQLKDISDLVGDDAESVSDDEIVQSAAKAAAASKKTSSAKKSSQKQQPLSQKSRGRVAGIRLIDQFNADEISNPDSVIENEKIQKEMEHQRNKGRIDLDIPQQVVIK